MSPSEQYLPLLSLEDRAELIVGPILSVPTCVSSMETDPWWGELQRVCKGAPSSLLVQFGTGSSSQTLHHNVFNCA